MDLKITAPDVRIAAGGAALALTIGLLLGGALHPNLAGDDRPAGPQMILGQGAARTDGGGDTRAELTSYAGNVPDYVLGTDWKRATTLQEPAAAPPPEMHSARNDDAPAVVFTRADYQDDEPAPAPRRGRYPTLGDANLPSRAPVGQAVDDSAEEPTAH